jgi:spermidine/putrescine transport system permease protein
MRIYATARAAPTPALNALATILLVLSLLALVLAWFAFRRLSRGQETRLETFAAR